MEVLPIATISETPHWSENLAFAGFDPTAGIDLLLHIGRRRRDLTMWREVITIALPDGTVLVHRGIGRRQVDEIRNTTVVEQGVRYTSADGRHGYSHMERLVPGKLLADPP